MRCKGDGRLSVKLVPSGDELTDNAVEAGRQRIDRWLWHARLVRTRSAAAALATAGYVRINGTRIDAPGRMVRLGDVITVALDQAVRVVKVRGFTERRGPPNHGQELYEELRWASPPRPTC
jgi:ribosome-associated heat shock protein Hsp15